VEGWVQRWDERPGRRILLYAEGDAAGSLFRWAEAINRHTAYAARMACFRLNYRFHYPFDLAFPDARVGPSGFAELVEEADVVHVKDEERFPWGDSPASQAVLTSGKAVVFTHYGGLARLHRSDREYRRAVSRCEARVAVTPDLCFDWFEGRWIPLPIDSERFLYEWRDGRVVGHSPSNPERKGTSDFTKAASPLSCEVDLIQDVTHDECLDELVRVRQHQVVRALVRGELDHRAEQRAHQEAVGLETLERHDPPVGEGLLAQLVGAVGRAVVDHHRLEPGPGVPVEVVGEHVRLVPDQEHSQDALGHARILGPMLQGDRPGAHRG